MAFEHIKYLEDQKGRVGTNVIENSAHDVCVGQDLALGALVLVPQVGEKIPDCGCANAWFLDMVCRRLLSSQIDVPSKYLGLEREVSLRVDSPRMRALVEPCELGEQSQSGRDDVLLLGSCRGTPNEAAGNMRLQERLCQEGAVVEEIGMAGKDLEQECEYSSHL